MRDVVGNVAPELLNVLKGTNSEVQDAEEGKPASSRPGKSSMPPPPAPKMPKKVTAKDKTETNDMKSTDRSSDKSTDSSIDKSIDKDKSADKSTDKSIDKSTDKSIDKSSDKSTDKSIDTDKSVDKSPSQESGECEVNSSTHRAAHARLVRRMERVSVAEFPHMSKLWAGGRKDAR